MIDGKIWRLFSYQMRKISLTTFTMLVSLISVLSLTGSPTLITPASETIAMLAGSTLPNTAAERWPSVASPHATCPKKKLGFFCILVPRLLRRDACRGNQAKRNQHLYMIIWRPPSSPFTKFPFKFTQFKLFLNNFTQSKQELAHPVLQP